MIINFKNNVEDDHQIWQEENDKAELSDKNDLPNELSNYFPNDERQLEANVYHRYKLKLREKRLHELRGVENVLTL